jgi:small subunit ribosomal protein S8
MPVTDPIADLLTHIRNGQRAKRTDVLVPFSRLKAELATVLANEGWVGRVQTDSVGGRPHLRISLRYDETGAPLIRRIQRVSKPGARVYVRSRFIPSVELGFGMTILSTPKGLKTNRQARKEHLGGEMLCQVA